MQGLTNDYDACRASRVGACKSAAEAFEVRPPERELDGVARGCPRARANCGDASMLAKALNVGG